MNRIAHLVPILLFLALSMGVWAQAATPVPGSPWTDPVTGMRFAWVDGGCFDMGCDDSGCGRDERPVHQVCVNGFWLGETEVTQGQWGRVMDSNPSEFKLTPEHPVERVSWDAAQRFVIKLSAMNNDAYRLRLPSEAEWEYACRMGLRNGRSGGSLKSDSSTRPVASKPANHIGLYGMGDNLAEWVQDVYDPNAYADHNRDNPIHSGPGRDRVYRGDCWLSYPDTGRCTGRYHAPPGAADSCQGFRLALSPESPQPPAGAPAVRRTEEDREPDSVPDFAPGAEQDASPAPATQAPAGGAAVSNTLDSLRAEDVDGRLNVVFLAEKPFGDHTSFMVDTPPRMVVDLPGAWENRAPLATEIGQGDLARVRIGKHTDKLRIVFDFVRAPKATPALTAKGRVLTAAFEASVVGSATQPPTQTVPGPSAPEQAAKESPAPEPPGKPDNVLEAIRIYSRGNATSIELDTSGPVGDYAYFQLKDPDRLVVNLGGTWSTKESRDYDPAERDVRRITTQVLPDMLRMTFDLDGGLSVPPEVTKKERGIRIVVTGVPQHRRPAVEAAAQPAGEAPARTPAPGVAVPPSNRLEKLDMYVDQGTLSLDFFTTRPVEDFSYADRETPPGLVIALPGSWGVDLPAVRKVERGELRQIRTNKLSDRILLTLVFRRKPDPAPRVAKTPFGIRVVLPAPPDEAGEDLRKSAEGPKEEPAPARPRASILKPDEDKGDEVPQDSGFDFNPPATSASEKPALSGPMTGAPAEFPAGDGSSKAPPLAVLEDFRSQLLFTCKMSSASYQTLVWKHGNVPDQELATKIEPYKRVFEDIAFRKGSDVTTWERVQSPVYDLGVILRREGYEPEVCDNINGFSREQLEALYDATFNRNDRAGFQKMLRTGLVGK